MTLDTKALAQLRELATRATDPLDVRPEALLALLDAAEERDTLRGEVRKMAIAHRDELDSCRSAVLAEWDADRDALRTRAEKAEGAYTAAEAELAAVIRGKMALEERFGNAGETLTATLERLAAAALAAPTDRDSIRREAFEEAAVVVESGADRTNEVTRMALLARAARVRALAAPVATTIEADMQAPCKTCGDSQICCEGAITADDDGPYCAACCPLKDTHTKGGADGR